MTLLTAEKRASVERVTAFMPRVIPGRWVPIDAPIPGMVAYVNRAEGLTVILTAAPYDGDGRWWLHFSVASKTGQPPSWDQLIRAKEGLLGAESKAIQVIAPRSQWVNQHPGCLHLFVCLDADPLPDFTEGSGSL